MTLAPGRLGRTGPGTHSGGWHREQRHSLTRALGEPSTGPARWVLAVAVFGAVMGASFSLGGVLVSFGWFPRASVVVAATLLFRPCCGEARRWVRSLRWAPWPAGSWA